mgnify:FL=1|jgi:hypothetical protein
MIDTLKTIGISAVVVIVALLLTGNIGSTAGVGGTYEITKQYFSAGLEATDVSVTDDLTVTDDTIFGTSAATTTINFGKACWEITTSQGSTTYAFFRSTGTLATSSTSCN